MRAIVPLLFVALGITLFGFASVVDAGERMSPELLWKLNRVGGGSLSPDGQHVVYTVRSYDLAENKGTTDIHLVDPAGDNDRVLVAGMKGASGLQWVTTPKGVRLWLVTTREEEGGEGEGDEEKKASPQVWSLDPESGDFEVVTNFDHSISNLKVSPTGKHIAFTTDVKMDAEVTELYPDLPKADARIIDSLMYRHWNAWHDYKYSHIHVAAIGDDGKAGEAVDLMDGLRVDCPVPPFGGADDFAWSPDGTEIAFTAKFARNWAESTDTDVYLVPASGEGRIKNITAGMEGYDNTPVYSPDGRTLAFLSMERAGFESDRARIFLHDRSSGNNREITVGLDQTVHSPTWSPDSQSIYFYSERLGTDQIFRISTSTSSVAQLSHGQYNWNVRDVSSDGKTLLVGRRDMIRPWELYSMPAAGGAPTRITGANDEIYADLELPTVKERWVRASDGKRIHNWVIYPPNFDPKKKYPMLTYCQGGPQGQIGQWFSYRWNFHLMAAQGYVVIAVNRRGVDLSVRVTITRQANRLMEMERGRCD